MILNTSLQHTACYTSLFYFRVLFVVFILLCCILGCLERHKRYIKKPKAKVHELQEYVIYGSPRSISFPYVTSLDVDIKQREDECKFKKTNNFHEIQGPPEYSTLT